VAARRRLEHLPPTRTDLGGRARRPDGGATGRRRRPPGCGRRDRRRGARLRRRDPGGDGLPRPPGGDRLPSDRGDPAIAPPAEPPAAGSIRGRRLRRDLEVVSQRIRKADDDGTTVVRHDGRVPPAGVGDGFAAPAEPTEIALDRFYDLLLETGERRQFSFGPRDAYLAWWRSALRAGHLVYLEARSSDGAPQAGLVLYRHGERLSTVHSGDHAAARRDHPGALHLLRWRAIQLAIRENRNEMDLGGVDVAGSRREPREG